MRTDLRVSLEEAIDRSHHGRPTIVQTVHSGRAGRPSFHIDPDFLRWAYSLRTTSAISRFLGVSRITVRRALLEYGIVERQEAPHMGT